MAVTMLFSGHLSGARVDDHDVVAVTMLFMFLEQ